jgi:hypothetical protein
MRTAEAVACALVLLLLAPGGFPAAGAAVSTSIVPGKSLGPVHLGMSEEDVTRVLGQPAPGPGGEALFPDWDVTVTFRDGVAVRLGTTNAQFRTASGAGVGIRIDDATRLVGDRTLDVTVVSGDTDVFYPSRGIGFVFYRGVALEVFVVAPGSATNLAFAPAAPGLIRPGPVTFILGPSPAPPQAPPAKVPRTLPAAARPDLALENVTSMVDPEKGLFRISGEIANVGSTTLDGVTVAATFVKRSGDEARRQVVIPQPVAAGASAPFSLETPLLQSVAGGDFVVRYTTQATARDGGLTLAQSSYTVPPETYAELAQRQVKVNVEFGAPSNTIPRVQVLISIGGTGSIPPTWIRDVLVEIPFEGGSQQIHLQPGQTVTILVPPVLVRGILCVGTAPSCFPAGLTSPKLLGEPAVLSVALAMP